MDELKPFVKSFLGNDIVERIFDECDIYEKYQRCDALNFAETISNIVRDIKSTTKPKKFSGKVAIKYDIYSTLARYATVKVRENENLLESEIATTFFDKMAYLQQKANLIQNYLNTTFDLFESDARRFHNLTMVHLTHGSEKLNMLIICTFSAYLTAYYHIMQEKIKRSKTNAANILTPPAKKKTHKKKSLKIEEDDLCCPLSLERYVDPVIAEDGCTYEREFIERWFEKNDSSPMHGTTLRHKTLIRNIVMKRIVDAL